MTKMANLSSDRALYKCLNSRSWASASLRQNEILQTRYIQTSLRKGNGVAQLRIVVASDTRGPRFESSHWQIL